MNNRYLCFCTVVNTGSFTRTAHQLGYTQSAVSQMIKALEEELGTTLVERRKDGVCLTGDGREFYPYIRDIVLAEKALEDKKHGMAGLENATITLAGCTSTGVNFLPVCIAKFKERYPTVKFVVKQGDHSDTCRWISEGVADIGFIMQGAEENLETSFLYHDEMVAVMPKSHPLAGERQISLNQLKGESFILMDEGSCLNIYNSLAAESGMPHINYKVYDDYTIIAMVKQGLGISILYRTLINSQQADVATVPIAEKPKRTMLLACKNRHSLPIAAQKFAQLVEEYLKKNPPC